MKECSYTSTNLYVFIVWLLIKSKDDVCFTYVKNGEKVA
jgi:hypothetical protein